MKRHRLFGCYLDTFHLEETREGQEYLAVVGDLLERPEVKRLATIRHHYSVTRLQHAISVSYLSYLRCRRRGLNAAAVARAALLHDLFYQHAGSREDRPRFLLCRHPSIALKNARSLLPLSSVDEDVIGRHMFPFGPLPRTKEGRIVSNMDKYCATQEFLRRCLPAYYRKKDTKKRKDLTP